MITSSLSSFCFASLNWSLKYDIDFTNVSVCNFIFSLFYILCPTNKVAINIPIFITCFQAYLQMRGESNPKWHQVLGYYLQPAFGILPLTIHTYLQGLSLRNITTSVNLLILVYYFPILLTHYGLCSIHIHHPLWGFP
jgi:hypothetical protein